MDGIEKALLNMVRAGLLARKLDETLLENGYSNTPYSLIYGHIADAIYELIGEHTEMLKDSVTYTALNAPFLCDERRTALLLHTYRINHAQPSPVTFEQDETEELYKKNGGYTSGKKLHETPEGDWS